ncbi:phosphodiesterase/alkaline phosphatase D-like protein [Bradyrhizobium sp. LB7.2]
MASLRASRAWTRRQFLVRSTSSLAAATLAKPHLSRAADRPQIAGGIQSGDASDGSAVVRARADRPARMQVECSIVESFKTIIASASSDALPDTDFTSKLLLNDLPLGQDIFYRVRFDDIAIGIADESRIGHFRTAPAAGRSISFLWSGDTAGQGWGIDTSRRLSQLSHHARQSSGLLHPFRRSHLRRLHDSLGAEAAERRDLAECRDRGEIRDRAHAGAVPRQLQIQPRRSLTRS